MEEAGVLVRGIDASSDEKRPWLPCESGWCVHHSDHMSGSVVYPGHADTYGAIGFIINPALADVRCIFPRDGGTQNTPGACKARCDLTPGANNPGVCSYYPPDLHVMFTVMPADRSCERRCEPGGMNEVVMAPEEWRAQMPYTLLGFFVKPSADPSGAERRKVERIRSLFLAQYGMQPGEAPVLLYDPHDRITPWASE
eukprot:scaffold9945_cov138-Isochrysis_galbana.AAC.2